MTETRIDSIKFKKLQIEAILKKPHLECQWVLVDGIEVYFCSSCLSKDNHPNRIYKPFKHLFI